MSTIFLFIQLRITVLYLLNLIKDLNLGNNMKENFLLS